MQVLANGVTFHTQEIGAGERPGVVMLHGLLIGTLAAWYFTAAPALGRERRVLLYDLRGHGRSERTPAGYDVATMAADLAALAGPFDSRPLDLVGHSYGALIALRFALDHPERVRRLVLVEAPLPPSSFHELDTFTAQSPEQMIGALPDELRAFVAQGGRKAARLLESIRFLVADCSLMADLRAEADIADAALARLACPVLCVYGSQSSCRPVGDRLARVLPQARLEVLAGGHYLHLDAAAELTRLMAEFLDG
jgi:pimeloyl-ACP methyl ester carboxylesterase